MRLTTTIERDVSLPRTAPEYQVAEMSTSSNVVIKKPGRILRLSALLAELAPAPVSSGDSAMSPSEPRAHASHEAPLPERASPAKAQEWAGTRSNITVGEILDRTRHAGFGFSVALLALLSMPIGGLSVPFGLAVAFMGIQMMAGASRPWLPRRIRAHAVSVTALEWVGRRLTRWTAGLERLIRPRFPRLAEGPFWIVCGVAVTLQGIGLALPLPIPFSNALFAIPLVLYGIGLLESDGLLIMLAHAITTVQCVLGVLFSDAASHAIVTSWEWLLKTFG